MQKNLTTFVFVFCLFAVSMTLAAVTDTDIQFLTEGVDGIGPSGSPGPLCVFGENAAAVIAGKEGNTLAPLLAATTFGKGRVLAFGHNGYLSKNMFASTDGARRLASNMFRWLTHEKQSAKVAVWQNAEFADCIATLGYEVQKIDNFDGPNTFQVLVMDGARLPENQIAKVSTFISNGGGLLTASLGWGWLQVSGKTDLRTEHPGNLLLAPMGIVWTDGYLDTTTVKNEKKLFAVSPNDSLRLLNVTKSLAAIELHEKGTEKLDPKNIAQAVATVGHGIRSIPSQQSNIFAPLEKFRDKEIIPTAKNKIRRETMPVEVLAMTLQTEQYLKKQLRDGVSGSDVKALPAAKDFPGPVPNDAKTVFKTVGINTKVQGWHSLGLYAAPGKTVTVTIPPELAASRRPVLGIRIGCHSDQIWGADEWSRFPEISVEMPCRNAVTKIANPFGGLVYITVPRKDDRGSVSIKIDGCVEAPLFILGKTSLNDWKNTIRNAPAPWGELASDRLILSLPSQHLRNLDDPDKVMEFWNKVLDDQAELCGRPIQRERPERIVCDRQISAGYMHSGYPVMTHMDVEKQFVDLRNNIAKGGWGFFHEFGHNHQSGDWTFDGTGEVTVNLFTLYCFSQFGINRETAHAEQRPAGKYKKRDEHFAAGSPYNKWKSDPFLALTMYTDIIDEFGWEPFKAVFREYRNLSNNERPKNDDEKRDQWMVRMSRQLGKNLGPYFDRWGVPVSQNAKDSIKDLPNWMPY